MNGIFFKRIYIVKLISYILLIILVLKLYNLMVFNHKEIYEKAKEINNISLYVDNDRNDILDRNSKKITGINILNYAVIFSSGNNDTDFMCCEFIEKYCGEDKFTLYNKLRKHGKVYVSVTNKSEIEKKNRFNNLKVFSLNGRYPANSPLSAVVGYISDKKGVSGLEYIYNDILSKSNISFRAMSDANMNFLPGGDVSIHNSEEKMYVKTTLDLELSQICYDVFSEYNVKGGAVLLDVNTFDVLSMVSYPSFDQNNIGDYLDSKDGNLSNRCLLGYDMGSVFKIVVACAALENGFDENKIFNCNGAIDVSGKKIECHNIYGHGDVNICDAFSKSCNPAFIKIGEEIGYKKIINMACKFGFGEKILYPKEFMQSAGKLPDINNTNPIECANISIGQGDLSSTVVQGAVLSCVIANKGVRKNVNLVEGIADKSGRIVESKRFNKSYTVISKDTAEKVYNMMIDANITGTGTNGFIEFFGSGGKTGSAQTGWVVNGEVYQHGWYTGFFPIDNPQYALCVFVENGKSGSESACPIFKDIGRKILMK